MRKRPHYIESGEDFEAEVLGAEGLVLVGFWADWSGACHLMSPVMEAIALDLQGRMTVVLVDIDRATELATRHGIESVPTLLFFHGGHLVDRISGTIPQRRLVERAESLLADGGRQES